MRAVILEDFGVWKVGDVPEPQPEAGDVVVEVRAAGMNPSDWKLADGWYRSFVEYEFPMFLGRDYAGVIVAVGSATQRFAVGDDVFGHVPGVALGRRGTFAQRVVLPEASCMARKPDALPMELAAALPVGGMTAQQCVEHVDPRPGESVLVVGAVGGVGSVAVQLLRLGGAHVVATALPADAEYLRGLGASDVVDYRKGTAALVAERYPDGINHLVDLAGTDDEHDAVLKLIKPGGRVASSLHRAGTDRLPAGLFGLDVRTPDDPESLVKLARAVVGGDVTVKIERTTTLEGAPAALRALRDEHVRGKVVVRLE